MVKKIRINESNILANILANSPFSAYIEQVKIVADYDGLSFVIDRVLRDIISDDKYNGIINIDYCKSANSTLDGDCVECLISIDDKEMIARFNYIFDKHNDNVELNCFISGARIRRIYGINRTVTSINDLKNCLTEYYVEYLYNYYLEQETEENN